MQPAITSRALTLRPRPHSPPRSPPHPPGTASAQSCSNLADALNQGDYSRIKEVVSMLGLTKTFSNPDLAVTVFVPNNGAFSAAEKQFAGASGGNTMALLQQNKGIMQQIVYYHIVRKVVKAPLPKETFQTFIQDKTLKGDGMKVIGAGSSANIIRPNIACGKSMAHGISNVLMFANLSG